MREEGGQGKSPRQRKKGNILLMTSGSENQFNIVNQEVIMGTLSLSDTCIEAALLWFPV